MPRGKLPPPEEPIHTLLSELEELRLSLSRVEMYDSFVRASEFGRNCQYSKKALLVFCSHDYEPLKKLLTQIQNTITEVECRLQQPSSK
jgi:hypothetical protein